MHSAILPALMLTAASGGMRDFSYMPAPPVTLPHQMNFRWRNQRQIRKNARRANAAGKRNAFA